MPQSTSASRRTRRIGVLVCLCLALVIGGAWRWNVHRTHSPFYGRWRLVDAANDSSSRLLAAEFQPDGRANLPWVVTPAGSVRLNHGLSWRVSAGELIVGPHNGPPPLRDYTGVFLYWTGQMKADDSRQSRLEIVEVGPQKLRLRLKADGAPESVYVRVDGP